MHISVTTPDALDARHIVCWREIQLGNPDLASPYFSPEYTLLVASVRDDIYVAIIREGEKIKGFFPFQKSSKFTAGPVGGPLSDYQGLILENGYEIDAKEMLRRCGLKTWKFNHLLASQSALQPYHEIRDVSFLIDLSEGVDKYLQDRRNSGSKLISSISRKQRKLEREVGPISFLYHTGEQKVLAKMFNWKSQQYQKSGHVDAFSFSWTRELMEAIHKTQTKDFAGVLSALYADNNLVAVHMGMRSDKVWHWWFPAYSQEYSKYSPGSILLMEMIQSVPERNLQAIDLGKGRSRYKDQFSNSQVELAEGDVSLGIWSTKLKPVAKSIANFIRRTPLVVPARIPAKLIWKYRRWKDFS